MNYKQAFSLGVIPPGVWDGKGEPVAYLYNGVVLPKLPEWDKSKYPYAVITVRYLTGTEMVQLFCLSKAYTANEDGEILIFDGTTHLVTVSAGSIGSIDSFGTPHESSTTNDGGVVPTWANFDILNQDGTVYLAATDPIPVYE